MPKILKALRVKIFRTNGSEVSDLVGEVDSSDLATLNDELEGIQPLRPHRLGRTQSRSRIRGRTIENVVIGTSTTKIAHGMPSAPYWYSVHPHGAESWAEAKRADDTYIYLVANSQIRATILVEA
jgi:hypothetical protein